MVIQGKSSEFRSPKQWARENIVSAIILIFLSRSKRSRSFEEIQNFLKQKRICKEKRKIPSSKSTVYKHIKKLIKTGFIEQNNRGRYTLRFYGERRKGDAIFHAIYNWIGWGIVKETPWLRRYANWNWPTQISLREKLTFHLKQLTRILEVHYDNDEGAIKKVKFEIRKDDGGLIPVLYGVYGPPIGKNEKKTERKQNEEWERRAKEVW